MLQIRKEIPRVIWGVSNARLGKKNEKFPRGLEKCFAENSCIEKKGSLKKQNRFKSPLLYDSLTIDKFASTSVRS